MKRLLLTLGLVGLLAACSHDGRVMDPPKFPPPATTTTTIVAPTVLEP